MIANMLQIFGNNRRGLDQHRDWNTVSSNWLTRLLAYHWFTKPFTSNLSNKLSTSQQQVIVTYQYDKLPYRIDKSPKNVKRFIFHNLDDKGLKLKATFVKLSLNSLCVFSRGYYFANNKIIESGSYIIFLIENTFI